MTLPMATGEWIQICDCRQNFEKSGSDLPVVTDGQQRWAECPVCGKKQVVEPAKQAPKSFTEFVAEIASDKRPRVKGSCRFSPYYKAQWYDETTLAWRDIPERFDTPDNAKTRFTGKLRWRVMEISMAGRNVL